MSIFRPLNELDRSAIESLLISRPVTPGMNWTTISILHELNQSESLGYFKRSLEALILFKDMTTVLEIFLIFSRSGSMHAGKEILNNLINTHRQARQIWLEVHEDNTRAICFYEQQGFVRVSTRSLYYPDGKQALNYSLTIA